MLEQNFGRRRTGRPLADVVMLTLILFPMVLAAAIVTGLAFVVAQAGSLPSYIWLIVSPILYLVWLILYLAIASAMMSAIGKRFPKPRHLALSTSYRQGISRHDLGVIASTAYAYSQYAVVKSLPLLSVLEPTSLLWPLIYRSYAPALYLGRKVRNWGVLYDPDLTEIGDSVIIGGGAVIAAHSLVARPDGGIVYVSVPVTIGARATIGGEARVALGCVIGEDAVIEPGAVVAAFTRVPAGEVWGGHPARFLRKRDMVKTSSDGLAADETMIPNGTDSVSATSGSGSGPNLDRIRRLVIDALGLDASKAPDDLKSETCPDWDSLGQIAIAAAVFDRYGVILDEGDLYRIRTLRDVADAIAGRRIGEPIVDAKIDPSVAPSVDEHAVQMESVPSPPDDLDMLPLLDPRDATRLLAERFEAEQGNDGHVTPLRVAIAATFTAQPVATSLRLWGRASGFEIDCQFADYDQIVQTLINDGSAFGTNGDGVNVLLLRPEDLPSESPDQASAQIEQILQAIQHFTEKQQTRGQLLVGTLPPVVSSFSLTDQHEIEALRQEWRSRLRSIPGVEIFDFSRLVERIGIDQARSNSGEALHRAPYSARLYQELGIALVRQIRSKRRSPAKVIAIDCDNTLWGGVVGEVGSEGIQLGPDGPGRSFQLFQHYLKHLKNRGILLAVVSRNEERDVLDVFENHPEMILRPNDIAAWAVNWNHKSESLRELAEEMNLGIDSFVFLDDDPAVRAEVMTRRPEVHVVPLPSDPDAYCETLSRLWLFDGAQATAVDAARTQMMQEEGRRKREERTVGSLDQFLASLELRVEMGPPTDQEWPRVAQLTQRTNQFSLSLKRRTLEEVKTLGTDTSVLVLKASDRFGDYGLVGVGIVKRGSVTGTSEIDTLLMSCRALGRGVEDAFLHGLAQVAAGQGSDTIVAPFVQGPRNGMIKDFLVRSGFEEIESNLWTLSIAQLPPLPDHVDFRDPRRAESGAD